jgi:hypothetical protein
LNQGYFLSHELVGGEASGDVIAISLDTANLLCIEYRYAPKLWLFSCRAAKRNSRSGDAKEDRLLVV